MLQAREHSLPPWPLARERRRARAGFTLIELLVVLAILALMMTIAAPRYIDHVGRARETALRTDLKVIRESIDKFEGDQGRLPKTLDELVDRRYLKEIPVDPITEKHDSWIALTQAEVDRQLASSARSVPAGSAASKDGTTGDAMDGVADVRSGADGKARDGSSYREW